MDNHNYVGDLIAALKAYSPGAIGAAFAALSGPARQKLERVVEFCGGCTLTVVATEPLLHWFQLDKQVYWLIMAFTVGYAGLSITSKGLEAIRKLNVAKIIEDKLK